MYTLIHSFNTQQKIAALLLLFCLIMPMFACDDSSGDNPKLEEWQNNPVGALEENYNQAYDDSNLDTAACEAANLLVSDMTKQDYCK